MRVRVHADEIRPGDVIRYQGHRYRIAGVSRRPGWAWSIAIDGDGWAIALDEGVMSVWRG